MIGTDKYIGVSMIHKKVLISAVVLSILGHMAVIALSSVIALGPCSPTEKAFTVHIEEQPETIVAPEHGPDGLPQEKSPNALQKKSEDTVELDDPSTKYYAYLREVKKRIEKRWLYPREAYTRKEKGSTVITFSITEAGALVNSYITTSSGYLSLDNEALRVVQSVGPLAPLPQRFHLSKLNVMAKFHYSLAE